MESSRPTAGAPPPPLLCPPRPGAVCRRLRPARGGWNRRGPRRAPPPPPSDSAAARSNRAHRGAAGCRRDRPGSAPPRGARVPRSVPETLHRCRKRSEEHTSELQSLRHLVCRLLLEKKEQKSELDSPFHVLRRSGVGARTGLHGLMQGASRQQLIPAHQPVRPPLSSFFF